jgi:hypothetical protein
MDQSIKAGIIGIILAIVLNISLPFYIEPPFDFLPTFMVAIIVIFLYRLTTLKDGLITALMTYFFSQGILNTTILALLYAANEPYPTITIDASLIIDPLVAVLSAAVAAYIGVWLAKQRTPPSQRTLQPPTDIPPDMQTV